MLHAMNERTDRLRQMKKKKFYFFNDYLKNVNRFFSHLKIGTNLSLPIGFESEKASDLLGTCVDDARTDVVLRVRVDAFEEFHSRADEFGANVRRVDWLRRLEDLLRFLVGAAQILPARKESFRIHFRRLEKLVDHQRELQTEPLLHTVVQEEDR